jgi:plastocyanin
MAAEKSKVPFYIAGGVLAAWAVIVSVGIGMRRSDFPGSTAGQRLVMAISALLVVATVLSAVVTSGSPAKAAATSAAGQTPPAGGTASGAPSGGAPTSSAPTSPSAPGPAASTPLALAASPGAQLSFDTKQLSAKAGRVTISFSNPSSLEHNVTVAEASKTIGATPTFTSGTRTLTLNLKRGSYVFFCSVPGHRQAGMEGTLSVT